MAFGDGDIATFFQDGDIATLAGTPDPVQVRGFLDFPEDVERFGGLSPTGAVTSRATFTCDAVHYPRFVKDLVVTCKGQTFKVRSVRRADDGQIAIVDL